jgi:hypothetical protein
MARVKNQGLGVRGWGIVFALVTSAVFVETPFGEPSN